MTDPHLRPLTRRGGRLPDEIAAQLPLWAEAAKRAGPGLARLLDGTVEIDAPALTMRSWEDLRREPPGVLCPLTAGGRAGSWCALSRADAARLASLLLHEEPRADEAEPGTTLDALLARPVVSALCKGLGATLGVPIEVAGVPVTEWPAGGEDDARLVATLTAEVAGGAVTFRLIVADPALFASRQTPPAPAPQALAATLSCPIEVSAVLDSWRAGPELLSRLSPGAVIPLPGASVDALDVRVRTEGGSVSLGAAEMGRDRSHRAVRLTRPAPLC